MRAEFRVREFVENETRAAARAAPAAAAGAAAAALSRMSDDLKLYAPAAIALLVLLALLAFVLATRGTKVELHPFQLEFLEKLAPQLGAKGAAGALSAIVARAVDDTKVFSAVFDDFHCIHCGSVKPADWIKTKCGKKPYTLKLAPSVTEFLSSTILVPVKKVGEPPKKMVVDGDKRADLSKAARCCVDWAVKNYGAVADGVPKPE